MSNAPTVEKYLRPKELASALCEHHGICMTEARVRDIRRKARAKGLGKLFVLGLARESEFVQLLRDNGDRLKS